MKQNKKELVSQIKSVASHDILQHDATCFKAQKSRKQQHRNYKTLTILHLWRIYMTTANFKMAQKKSENFSA